MATEDFSWLAFFLEAGIPEMHAQSYAEVFEDNRIQHTMMEELNKEVLQELGVAVMGDVIAIQRAARQHMESMQPVDTVRERKWEIEKNKLRRQITTLEQQKSQMQNSFKTQLADTQNQLQEIIRENKLLKAKMHAKVLPAQEEESVIPVPSVSVPPVTADPTSTDAKLSRKERFQSNSATEAKRAKTVSPAAIDGSKPSILSRISQESKPKKTKGRGSFKADQANAAARAEQQQGQKAVFKQNASAKKGALSRISLPMIILNSM